jgi:hypothetical protein
MGILTASLCHHASAFVDVDEMFCDEKWEHALGPIALRSLHGIGGARISKVPVLLPVGQRFRKNERGQDDQIRPDDDDRNARSKSISTSKNCIFKQVSSSVVRCQSNALNEKKRKRSSAPVSHCPNVNDSMPGQTGHKSHTLPYPLV